MCLVFGVKQLSVPERASADYFINYQTYLELTVEKSWKEESAKYLELNSWMVLKEGKC